MNYNELTISEMIAFLRGFAVSMDKFGYDTIAEVIEAAADRLKEQSELIEDMNDRCDILCSREDKFLKWFCRNVPNGEKALDEMGFTEIERLGIDVAVDFKNFIESEEYNNDNRENECTSGFDRAEND